MPTYAIGDIQGCYASLQKLLNHIQFNPNQDTLWFTGDLVNRGTQSLETLRFIKQLGDRHHTILGNHDLHLLAVLHSAHPGSRGDTFDTILSAPDREELTHWLLQQPLLHHDEKNQFTMVHAGVSPNWDIATARSLAKEVEMILQSDQRSEFFQKMYGNHPNHWTADLKGFDRLRCITNYFTRARFCYPDGSLELNFKGEIHSHPENLMPWFQVPNRKTINDKIIFGHWAALGGVTNTANTYALDTGCVWGFKLTAMRLEDEKRFSVACEKKQDIK